MIKKFIANYGDIGLSHDELISPENAVALFNGRMNDRDKANALFGMYEGNEETELIKEQKQRALNLIEAHVRARYGDIKTTQQSAMADKMRTELLNSCALTINNKWKPGTTAGNIADNYVERITNDPMPLDITDGADDRVKDILQELQDNSDWEETLKDVVLNAVICGVGVIMLSVSKDQKRIQTGEDGEDPDMPVNVETKLKFFIESLSPLHCLFIKRGAEILYAYYMPNDSTINIFDRENMYTYTKSQESWAIKGGAMRHNFGAVPMRPVLFNSGKGCFEKCVGDIAAFDLTTYLMICEANDPRAAILLAGGSIENVMRSSVVQGVESKWLVKPEAFSAIAELRKYAKANISEASKYVFIEDMVGGQETATKTREVISGFNSVMRSFGVNLRSAILHALAELEYFHKTVYRENINIIDNVIFEPHMQDIINVQDIFTIGRGIMSEKTLFKMLLGYTDTQAEDEWLRKVLEVKELEAARMSSALPQDFQSGVDRQTTETPNE